MSTQPNARETLDTLLGYLGFVTEIEEQDRDGHLILQVHTHDAEFLTGRHLEILDDLQHLVNRLLQAADPQAERVTVDVEHHREIRDDALVAKVRQLAEAVLAQGRPLQTEPLNSYDRFLVHNTFKDHPEIMTWSPKDDARLKRITLRKRSRKE